MSVQPPRTLTPADVLGPDAAALLAQVQAVLAPQHHDLLEHLLGAVDTHVCAELRTDEAQRWSALLAHIPGYAPDPARPARPRRGRGAPLLPGRRRVPRR